MRRQILFVAVCAALAACAAPKIQAPEAAAPPKPSPKQQAVAQQTRTYALGKVPDQDREQAFQDLLDSAQAQAAKKYSGEKPLEIGFSYSLTPRGAVYPFSAVEVSCLVQAAHASGPGAQLCLEFFRVIDSRIKKIAAPD